MVIMRTSILLLFLSVVYTESSSDIFKCCPDGYAFSDHLKCVISTRSENRSLFDELSTGNGTEFEQNCYRSGESVDEAGLKYERNSTGVDVCRDIHYRNGTVYLKACPVDWKEKIGTCDSIFRPLLFWGASIVLFANLIYIFPYLIVVVFYFVIPDLRHRAYDKAVLGYNASQVLVAAVLLGTGYFILCHKPIHPSWLYILLGATLQFSTIASVFWLNVICLEMTLVITRFRWIPGSDITGSDDNRKHRMYSIYAWGGAFLMTSLTCFIELCPWIPITSPIKPNFQRFDDGANLAVIVHVLALPVVALVFNNIFFIYTTYKVIQIRKSTATANQNNKNVNRKYFMFLRLYLLMDAPSVIGALAAIYPEAWILKFCRMLQPILMLLAIVPKKNFYQAMKCCPFVTISKNKNKNKTVQAAAF